MLGHNMKQQSGDASTNIQAQVVNVGVTPEEARNIAFDLYRANAYTLTQEAAQIATARAERLVDDLLTRLMEKNPRGIDSFREPGMQYALYTAQREYVRTGDDNLADLLVDILVARTIENNRNLMQIVLDEAIMIAPKLMPEQYDILTLVFLVRYTKHSMITNVRTFKKYIDIIIAPFVSNLTKESAACYQHLEYTGCCSIMSLMTHDIIEIFKETYQGIFVAGFMRDKFEDIINPNEVGDQLLIPCKNNPLLWQIDAMDNNEIETKAGDMGYEKGIIEQLKSLQISNLMSSGKIRIILEQNDYMKKLIEYWNDKPMHSMNLTTVGMAIAHANIRIKIQDDNIDLSDWIK